MTTTRRPKRTRPSPRSTRRADPSSRRRTRRRTPPRDSGPSSSSTRSPSRTRTTTSWASSPTRRRGSRRRSNASPRSPTASASTPRSGRRAQAQDHGPGAPSGEAAGVTLTTVHAVKGLEWPHCTVLMPERVSSRSSIKHEARRAARRLPRRQKEHDISERNLAYVALTRAAKNAQGHLHPRPQDAALQSPYVQQSGLHEGENVPKPEGATPAVGLTRAGDHRRGGLLSRRSARHRSCESSPLAGRRPRGPSGRTTGGPVSNVVGMAAQFQRSPSTT